MEKKSERGIEIIQLLKKNWHWFILAAILLLGFYIRIYHIDYPVIGYHNMKEAHTLGEAWFMYESGDYFVNKEIYSISFLNPNGSHMDNFPLLAWIIIVLWKIFGVKIWLARLVIILFSLGAIYFSYLVVRKLFKREDIAILSAFLISICPLLIFFGRNVQYDMPALFFMMVAIYFFLCWRENDTFKNFLLFCLLFTLLALTKLSFMIIVIPILAAFPYKRLDFRTKIFKEKYLKQYLVGFLFFLVIILFLYYTEYLNKVYSASQSINLFALENLPKLLTIDFWKAVYTYATVDNFTTLGLLIAFFGLILIIPKIKKWNYRFLLFWFFSYIAYAASSPPQMMGHNYYQIPYAPLIMILIAYSLLLIFNTILSFVKLKQKILERLAVFACILIVIIFWYPALKLSTTRQFDTQFYGLDIAGEYINENSLPNEVVFESGHQDRGMAWYAKRRLAEFNTVEDLKKGEDELNVSWVFIYQWGFQQILGNQELQKYIYDTYSLKQVAFIQSSQGNQPVYLLFKKDGSFNESDLNNMLNNRPINTKNYELTSGNFQIIYINI